MGRKRECKAISANEENVKRRKVNKRKRKHMGGIKANIKIHREDCQMTQTEQCRQEIQRATNAEPGSSIR